jgi:hypothetical protein
MRTPDHQWSQVLPKKFAGKTMRHRRPVPKNDPATKPTHLLLLVWVSLPQLISREAPNPLWWRHVLAVQAWSPVVGEAFAYNGPGWSIGVEFFLYACFPLLVFLFAPFSRRVPGTLLALGAVIAVMASEAVTKGRPADRLDRASCQGQPCPRLRRGSSCYLRESRNIEAPPLAWYQQTIPPTRPLIRNHATIRPPPPNPKSGASTSSATLA